MVVGRLLSYWEGNFSGAMLNFGRGKQKENVETTLSHEKNLKKQNSFFLGLIGILRMVYYNPHITG